MLEKIIFELEEKTRNSIEDSDLKKIFYHLEKINTPTLLCGVGGSHVVSIFLEKVLREKNHIIVKNIDVEEYFLGNFNQYDNLIAVSYSGKNHGIKSLMKFPKQKYLLTSRKSKIKDEVLLNYSISNRSKSFISLEDTFIPIHILTSYYLNSYSIYPKFHKINFNIKKFDKVNIIYDYDSIASAYFLESSFVEAGISSVSMHTKYSLCHGRTNLIHNQESLVIYFLSKNNELNQMLINELPKISNNFLVLKSDQNDPILSDYEFLTQSLLLLNELNKAFSLEFINVKYNKIIPTIYNFKGEFK